MGQKKHRKFVNKNDPNTVTFALVASTKDDPRIITGEAPPQGSATLKRIIPLNSKGTESKAVLHDLTTSLEPEQFGIHANLSDTDLEALCMEIYGEVPENIRERLHVAKEPQRKLTNDASVDLDLLDKADCYFPLDGYNYEQHLRPISTYGFYPATKTSTSAYTSTLTHKTLKNDLDQEEQEVLKALDGAEQFEELSDNFCAEAGSVADEDETLWGRHKPEDDDEPDLLDLILKVKQQQHELFMNTTNNKNPEDCSDEENNFNHKEADDEKELFDLLNEEYNEDGIGELEPKDMDVNDKRNEVRELIPTENLYQFLDQFERQNNQKKLAVIDNTAAAIAKTEEGVYYKNKNTDISPDIEHVDLFQNLDTEDKKKVICLSEQFEREAEINKDEEPEWFKRRKSADQWDCETILTTRSNIYNHPSVIGRSKTNLVKTINVIAKSQKIATTLKAVEEEPSLGDTPIQSNLLSPKEGHECLEGDPKADEGFDHTECPVDVPNVITHRPKNETVEEKRTRKKAAKEARRVIRQVKKENSILVKESKIQATKSQIRNPYDVPEGVRRFRI